MIKSNETESKYLFRYTRNAIRSAITYQTLAQDAYQYAREHQQYRITWEYWMSQGANYARLARHEMSYFMGDFN